jgi:hypothetical protein
LHLRAAAPPIPTPKLCFTRLASHANAQVSAGLSEMNVNGSLTVQSPEEGDSFTIMQLQLRYGYFLTPAIQVGALASAIKFEDEDTFGDVEAFGAYHFGAPGSMMVPYVGAHVGTGFGFDDNPLAFRRVRRHQVLPRPCGRRQPGAVRDAVHYGQHQLDALRAACRGLGVPGRQLRAAADRCEPGGLPVAGLVLR